MIDFHTHILPSIDDGSKNMEETVGIIKEAKEAGFDEIILTSHYIEGYYEASVSEREHLLNDVLKELEKEKIDVKLYLANEIYLTDNLVNLLKEKKASAINNSKYVLFEMPLSIKPMNLYDVIYSMQEASIVPILAHPERYAFIQNDIDLVYELINKGCLMQSNYGSILGQYGGKAKKVVKKLLKNNMVHFLGSDVHRENSIYPKVELALKKIQKIVGEEKLKRLTEENPRLVLCGEKIEM